jgi:hypothetical protein
MASTGLSPEWDRWFDEAFTDLVARDDELIRQEFDALIGASWQDPAPPPVPFNVESREGGWRHRGDPRLPPD